MPNYKTGEFNNINMIRKATLKDAKVITKIIISPNAPETPNTPKIH